MNDCVCVAPNKLLIPILLVPWSRIISFAIKPTSLTLLITSAIMFLNLKPDTGPLEKNYPSICFKSLFKGLTIPLIITTNA